MRKFKIVTLLIGVFLFAGLPAFANPVVISVSGPTDVPSLSVDQSDVLAVAWTQTINAYKTAINISFEGLFGGTFTAYLMDGIGTGATVVNEIAAPASFTVPPFQAMTSIDLWSGLNLGPSTYYIVVGTTDADALGGWGATSSPTIYTRPGVLPGDPFSNRQFFATGSDIDTSYLPASNFAIDDLSNGSLLFKVTTVPEPSTLALLATGALSLALIRRKRSV
jgi:hypothetical protein